VSIILAQRSSSKLIQKRFIHGGGWRDPEIDSKSFFATTNKLLSDDKYAAILPHIQAFVSIDYRLTKYPQHPTHPSKEDDKSRNAIHPDHLNDVKAALRYVVKKWGNKKFVFVGHSVGATLALQSFALKDVATVSEATLKGDKPKEESNPNPTAVPVSDKAQPSPIFPSALIGVSGLYALDKFVDVSSGERPEFIKDAFTDDVDLKSVSPTSFDYAAWKAAGGVALLAHSPEDGLVEASQVIAMRETLVDQEVPGRLLQATGAHDDIWAEGGCLPDIILEGFGYVLESNTKPGTTDGKTGSNAKIKPLQEDARKASEEKDASKPAPPSPADTTKTKIEENNLKKSGSFDASGYEVPASWLPSKAADTDGPPEPGKLVRIPILRRFWSYVSGQRSSESS
jgi:kynurenine formamidase